MKPIAMTMFGRPEYLSQTLDALSRCDGIDEYILVACVEPPGSADVVALLDRWTACPVDLLVNPTQLGCNTNTRQAVDRAFDYDDWMVLVEDDVVMAPDALRWLEWARQHQHGDVTGAMTYSLTGVAKSSEAEIVSQFCSWGCSWHVRHWEHIESVWPRHESLTLPSWDIDVSDGTGNWIRPVGSRSVNIGRENGVHQRAGAPWTLDAQVLAEPDGEFWLNS